MMCRSRSWISAEQRAYVKGLQMDPPAGRKDSLVRRKTDTPDSEDCWVKHRKRQQNLDLGASIGAGNVHGHRCSLPGVGRGEGGTSSPRPQPRERQHIPQEPTTHKGSRQG